MTDILTTGGAVFESANATEFFRSLAMFAPKTHITGAAPFQSRRRQRTDSNEFDKPPRAKRQRPVSLQESPERTGSLSRADEPIQFKEPAERDNSGHVHSLHDNGGEQKIPIRGPRNPEQQETSISGGAVTLVRYAPITYPSPRSACIDSW